MKFVLDPIDFHCIDKNIPKNKFHRRRYK